MKISIQELCDEFLNESNDAYIWETEVGATGECGYASQQFCSFLKSKNIEAELIGFSLLERNFFTDNHNFYRKNEYDNHMIVKIKNNFIDWTARQFETNVDFPYIFQNKKG